MKLTVSLAAALFLGSASLAAVQALPLLLNDTDAAGAVQVAAKSGKSSKSARASCKGANMYWSAKDKKCLDARDKKST